MDVTECMNIKTALILVRITKPIHKLKKWRYLNAIGEFDFINITLQNSQDYLLHDQLHFNSDSLVDAAIEIQNNRSSKDHIIPVRHTVCKQWQRSRASRKNAACFVLKSGLQHFTTIWCCLMYCKFYIKVLATSN